MYLYIHARTHARTHGDVLTYKNMEWTPIKWLYNLNRNKVEDKKAECARDKGNKLRSHS
jgi:hypothetical protein